MTTILDLHRQTLQDYQDFVQSFIQQELEEEAWLWPEPLVQLSPAYERDITVEEMAAGGALHPETARIFRRSDGSSFRLYRHQVEAIR